jgi:hypothetical protein
LYYFRELYVIIATIQFRNELTIEAKNTIQKVEVFNLLGQQVLSINPKANSAKIQTSSLSKGVYVITATIDDVVSSSKFIKQ